MRYLSKCSGGFNGFQVPKKDFRRLQKDLDDGEHIFIVDVDSFQQEINRQVKYENPYLNDAGTGSVTTHWTKWDRKA